MKKPNRISSHPIQKVNWSKKKKKISGKKYLILIKKSKNSINNKCNKSHTKMKTIKMRMNLSNNSNTNNFKMQPIVFKDQTQETKETLPTLTKITFLLKKIISLEAKAIKDKNQKININLITLKTTLIIPTFIPTENNWKIKLPNKISKKKMLIKMKNILKNIKNSITLKLIKHSKKTPTNTVESISMKEDYSITIKSKKKNFL
jgi:hypothetical protein